MGTVGTLGCAVGTEQHPWPLDALLSAQVFGKNPKTRVVTSLFGCLGGSRSMSEGTEVPAGPRHGVTLAKCRNSGHCGHCCVPVVEVAFVGHLSCVWAEQGEVGAWGGTGHHAQGLWGSTGIPSLSCTPWAEDMTVTAPPRTSFSPANAVSCSVLGEQSLCRAPGRDALG